MPNVARLYWYEADCTDSGSSTQNYYCIIDGNTYDVNSLTYTLLPAYTALKDLAYSAPQTTSGSGSGSSPPPTNPPLSGGSPTPSPTSSPSSTTGSSSVQNPPNPTTSPTNTVTYSVNGKSSRGPVNTNKLPDGKYVITQTINSGGHTTTKSQIITVDHKSFWGKLTSANNVKYVIGVSILLAGAAIFTYWTRVILRRRVAHHINQSSVTYTPVIIHPTNKNSRGLGL